VLTPIASAGTYRVKSGDTLSAIAARAETTVAALAQLNHLSIAGPLLADALLELPSRPAPTVDYRVAAGDSLSALALRFHTTIAALATENHIDAARPIDIGTTLRIPLPAGHAAAVALAHYVVRPGDSLSAIALRTGVSMGALSALNRLDPAAVLEVGTRLTLPLGATRDVAQTFDRSTVRGSIAYWSAHYGVNVDLAAALAWMESGFNNALVSDDGARGVMQVMPQTWSYVEQVLLLGESVPDSADGNVRVGIAYLHHLLHLYDGNERNALAAYYQGARALQQDGPLPGTDQYVNDVLALSERL